MHLMMLKSHNWKKSYTGVHWQQ